MLWQSRLLLLSATPCLTVEGQINQESCCCFPAPAPGLPFQLSVEPTLAALGLASLLRAERGESIDKNHGQQQRALCLTSVLMVTKVSLTFSPIL